jgi:cell surface protein SprA
VENLSLSYAYSDQEYTDVNTAFENTRTYRGSLAYMHNPKPDPSSRLQEHRLHCKSKWLKLIKDFNVNLGFKQITCAPRWTACTWSDWCGPTRTSRRCRHDPPTTRTSTGAASTGSATSITKSLKLDFNANNLAFIGETPGRVNAKDKDEYELWKDSVLTSIKSFGEVTRYDHTIGITYTLPWTSSRSPIGSRANTAYGAGYQWDRAPLTQDTLGNTIQNSQNIGQRSVQLREPLQQVEVPQEDQRQGQGQRSQGTQGLRPPSHRPTARRSRKDR